MMAEPIRFCIRRKINGQELVLRKMAEDWEMLEKAILPAAIEELKKGEKTYIKNMEAANA